MAERPECQAVDVLLVEDDPGDVLMTREAFGEAGPLTRPPWPG